MSDRHQIVNDQEFWTRLEYVATRWLEDSGDQNLRRFWIDGFLPENATNTKYGADVEGVAWVGNGPRRQDQYRFIASLPQKMLHRRTPGFTIERLSLDEGKQVLEIILASANPSAEPCTSPNGGPARRSGSSAASEGPPSVS
jgi:hypothetical protein